MQTIREGVHDRIDQHHANNFSDNLVALCKCCHTEVHKAGYLSRKELLKNCPRSEEEELYQMIHHALAKGYLIKITYCNYLFRKLKVSSYIKTPKK